MSVSFCGWEGGGGDGGAGEELRCRLDAPVNGVKERSSSSSDEEESSLIALVK